jgi:hypothetical protein
MLTLIEEIFRTYKIDTSDRMIDYLLFSPLNEEMKLDFIELLKSKLTIDTNIIDDSMPIKTKGEFLEYFNWYYYEAIAS